jgi:hypothetical protein
LTSRALGRRNAAHDAEHPARLQHQTGAAYHLAESPATENPALREGINSRWTWARWRETIDNMSDTECSSISEALRNTVIRSGVPYLRIEQATGVPRASISRFVARKRSLRLDMADRLAAFFGLALTVCVPDKGERARYER